MGIFGRIKDIYKRISDAFDGLENGNIRITAEEYLEDTALELSLLLQEIIDTGEAGYTEEVNMSKIKHNLDRGYHHIRIKVAFCNSLSWSTRSTLGDIIDESFNQTIYNAVAALDNFYIKCNGVSVADEIAAEHEA